MTVPSNTSNPGNLGNAPHSYTFKYTKDKYARYSDLEETVTVTAEKGRLSFKTKQVWADKETGKVDHIDKRQLPGDIGLYQCQSVPKCKEFVESFLKEKYYVGSSNKEGDLF